MLSSTFTVAHIGNKSEIANTLSQRNESISVYDCHCPFKGQHNTMRLLAMQYCYTNIMLFIWL